jgi:hypothetical protein
LMSHPVVARVVGDRRLMEIAREWAGGEAAPFRATLFEKTSLTNWLIPWHQDTALPMVERVEREGWGPWSEKAGVTYAHAPAGALSEVIALRLHRLESHFDRRRRFPVRTLSSYLQDTTPACLLREGRWLQPRPQDRNRNRYRNRATAVRRDAELRCALV